MAGCNAFYRNREPTLRRVLVATAASLIVASATSAASSAYVRESRTVFIDGHREIWRLEWAEKPVSVCGADAVYMAITMPCQDFAYGEAGLLWLIRERDGHDIDRMDLTPLYNESNLSGYEGVFVLRHWPMRSRDWDREDRGDATLVADVAKRKPYVVMSLADYDHDGRATEFVVEVDDFPRVERYAAIGISKDEPRLHAFSSAAHPGKPLFLSKGAWDALKITGKPSNVVDWPCVFDLWGGSYADGASGTRVEANHGTIRAWYRNYTCNAKGQLGKGETAEKL